MSMEKNLSKRDLLAGLGTIWGLGLIVSQFSPSKLLADERRRGAKTESSAGGNKEIDWPQVKPGEGVAAALSYWPNHKEAEKDSKTDKKTDKGTPWEKRFCNNCSFYTKVGEKNGMTLGKCSLFQKSLVSSEGLCNSWAKKA